MSNMKVKNKEQYLAKVLLDIYDSANSLYEDEKRLGSEDSFYEIVREHEILLAFDDTGTIGYLSYNKTDEKHTLISGLYVTRECQNTGVAGRLINDLKDASPGCVLWAKVLKNAAWAKDFYLKHGFELISDDSPLSYELGQPVKNEPWALLFAYSADAD